MGLPHPDEAGVFVKRIVQGQRDEMPGRMIDREGAVIW